MIFACETSGRLWVGISQVKLKFHGSSRAVQHPEPFWQAHDGVATCCASFASLNVHVSFCLREFSEFSGLFGNRRISPPKTTATRASCPSKQMSESFQALLLFSGVESHESFCLVSSPLWGDDLLFVTILGERACGTGLALIRIYHEATCAARGGACLRGARICRGRRCAWP